MASISATILTLHVFTLMASISLPSVLTASVIEDLNNLKPPSDFNTTLTKNCIDNPSLRYCNSIPFNLSLIFKSTIVAYHLCKLSRNPNCVESFPLINLSSKPTLATLYLSFTFFWQFCPLTVLSIDFSNSSLHGHFPTTILQCSQVRSLDFRLNKISGEIPLNKLSSLPNLTSLNLSYNTFSECRVSETAFLNRFDPSSFVHSGLYPDHTTITIKTILIFVVFPVCVIGTVACLYLCFCKNEHEFKASVLEEASGGFSGRNMIDKSGNSRVYKGVLRDGREVMIEVYFGRMDRRQFVEECKILVELDHRNILHFIGWCSSRGLMAVVAEWVEGESVESWMKNKVPTWMRRVQVMVGVGDGIRYLHEEWPQVRYKLTARNVIVSENGEPVISRFKLGDHHQSTAKKIHEFGVMVLEIVTGRRASEDFEGGFVEWVKLHYLSNLEGLIDKRMKLTTEIVSDAAMILQLGLVCADLSSRRQPTWDKFSEMVLKISHAHRGRGHKHVHHRHH